jgi:hypothetical protein
MWANDTSGAAISSSPRVYRGLEELTYRFHEGTFTVTTCGRICFKGQKVILSHVLCSTILSAIRHGCGFKSPARSRLYRPCSTSWWLDLEN